MTLVRAGAGLFPDSPTERGARHVAALAARADCARAVVLVVQRPDARAARANEPADPGFAAALRAALKAGVRTLAVRCHVSPAGIRLAGEIPLEWPHPGVRPGPLPDHVGPGLRLLFVGLNPGRYSAWYGMYFARPGNLFWPAVRAAGLVPVTAGPGDEAWLRRTLGIGFTDVVKRPTAGIAEVAEAEWRAGAARLRRLVRAFRPRAVCFVGLRGARAVLGAGAGPGPQPTDLEGARAFAVPSTSGRQAAYRRREVIGWFRALAAWLERPDG